MRLQYIASACVLVEHAGLKVLCDPWLVGGAYGGAWHHVPPLSVTPEDFADINYIYISHVHPDHYDEATLLRLPRVPVFIGRYAEAFLGNKLRAMGFPVCEGRTFDMADDFTMRIIPADDCDPQLCGRWLGCEIKNPKEKHSYQIDTVAVFLGGEHMIVNVNDCPFPLARRVVERIKDAWGSPELLCVGYAGAGPYPQCFPDVDRKAEAENKKAQFLKQAEDYITLLKPKRYLPFAGQYTLGGSLVDLNDFRGVPELEDLDAWGDERMVRLNRGAWFDCETRHASEPFVPVGESVKRFERERLRGKTLDHESDPWPTDWVELQRQAEAAWTRRCADRGFVIDWRVTICPEYDDGAWAAAWDIGNIESEKHLEISLDARLLRRLLTRQFHWNNAEVGSLLTFRRTPNVYDPGLYNALCYFHI